MEVGRRMTNMLAAAAAERDNYNLINFEETELRLGLPGGGGGSSGTTVDGETTSKNGGKRGFSETVDLQLNFPSKESDLDSTEKKSPINKEKNLLPSSNDPAKPPTKRTTLRRLTKQLMEEVQLS